MHYFAETIVLVFWIFVCLGIHAINLFPYSGAVFLALGIILYRLLERIPARRLRKTGNGLPPKKAATGRPARRYNPGRWENPGRHWLIFRNNKTSNRSHGCFSNYLISCLLFCYLKFRICLYFVIWNLLFLTSYVSGSLPPLLKGLHLKIRHEDFIPPRITPYFLIASYPYCEQVGWKRQNPCGNKCLIGPWSKESVFW